MVVVANKSDLRNTPLPSENTNEDFVESEAGRRLAEVSAKSPLEFFSIISLFLDKFNE